MRHDEVDPAKAARIAANRGVYFAGPSDMIVQVVEEGTEIESRTGGASLTVHRNVGVVRDNHLFVTQENWDAILRHPNIRTVR